MFVVPFRWSSVLKPYVPLAAGEKLRWNCKLLDWFTPYLILMPPINLEKSKTENVILKLMKYDPVSLLIFEKC